VVERKSSPVVRVALYAVVIGVLVLVLVPTAVAGKGGGGKGGNGGTSTGGGSLALVLTADLNTNGLPNWGAAYETAGFTLLPIARYFQLLD
jgi:hypothetical protein